MFGKPLISKHEQALIVKSIGSAELKTSGEIRVHIENNCSGDPVERAVLIFNKLKMYETAERNDVLIYVALKSHKFSIIGDIGIDSRVPENFWDSVKSEIATHFGKGEIITGISSAVELSGNKLGEFFPRKDNDINEQSNDVSFG